MTAIGAPPVLAGAVNEIVACVLPEAPTTPVGGPGATAVIAKVCDTCGAAPKLALPAWLALIVQFPADTMVILRLLAGVIVHTAGVVDVSVTGSAELAVAADAKGVVLNVFAPGLANVIVCAAAAIVSATICVAAGLTPFDAVTVKLNVPATVGVPASTPPAVSGVKPVGMAPAVTANVGAGEPVATKVCEYGVLTTPAAGAPDVKAGAALRFSVKLALIG